MSAAAFSSFSFSPFSFSSFSISPASFSRQRRALLCSAVWLPLLRQSLAEAKPATAPGADAMLATVWQPTLNPADYLVSEKLDGVRALWDGQTLRFRSGRAIAAPAWFLAGLPATPLDGELWSGRGSFSTLSGIVRKTTPVDAEWRTLRYMVFDLPHDSQPFAARAQRIAELLAVANQPWLQAVEQTRVADATALQNRLDAVTAAGGEGLVLHRRDGLWQVGRSEAVRKLKVVPDEEGRVLAQIAGTGKYQGRMGALLLQAPDGQQFSLGTGFSDADRSHPPAVGSLVTYRYRGRTSTGLPRFASFVRLREAE